MSEPALEQLRYPIGRWDRQPVDEPGAAAAIATLASLPERLRQAVAGLDEDQLDTPYRPQGWTVRQVVHHLADSHLNGYQRTRLALTEEQPTIKTYLEGPWAELADARAAPVGISLGLLAALHERWVLLLRSLSPGDLGRALHHPEVGLISLRHLLGLYDWHSRHHLAHVTGLRERLGW